MTPKVQQCVRALAPAVMAGDAHDAVALLVMACGLKDGDMETMATLHSFAAQAFEKIYEHELAIRYYSGAAYFFGLHVQDLKQVQVRCSCLLLPFILQIWTVGYISGSSSWKLQLASSSAGTGGVTMVSIALISNLTATCGRILSYQFSGMLLAGTAFGSSSASGRSSGSRQYRRAARPKAPAAVRGPKPCRYVRLE